MVAVYTIIEVKSLTCGGRIWYSIP